MKRKCPVIQIGAKTKKGFFDGEDDTYYSDDYTIYHRTWDKRVTKEFYSKGKRRRELKTKVKYETLKGYGKMHAHELLEMQ